MLARLCKRKSSFGHRLVNISAKQGFGGKTVFNQWCHDLFWHFKSTYDKGKVVNQSYSAFREKKKKKTFGLDDIAVNDFAKKLFSDPDKMPLGGTIRGIGSGKSETCDFMSRNLHNITPLCLSFNFKTPLREDELPGWNYVASNSRLRIGLTVASRIIQDCFAKDPSELKNIVDVMNSRLESLDMGSFVHSKFLGDFIANMIKFRHFPDGSLAGKEKIKVLLIVDEPGALEAMWQTLHPLDNDPVVELRKVVDGIRDECDIRVFMTALKVSPLGFVGESTRPFMVLNPEPLREEEIYNDWYQLQVQDPLRKDIVMRLLKIIKTLPRLVEIAEPYVKENIVNYRAPSGTASVAPSLAAEGDPPASDPGSPSAVATAPDAELPPQIVTKTLKSIAAEFKDRYGYLLADITADILACMVMGWKLEVDETVMTLLRRSVFTNIPVVEVSANNQTIFKSLVPEVNLFTLANFPNHVSSDHPHLGQPLVERIGRRVNEIMEGYLNAKRHRFEKTGTLLETAYSHWLLTKLEAMQFLLNDTSKRIKEQAMNTKLLEVLGVEKGHAQLQVWRELGLDFSVGSMEHVETKLPQSNSGDTMNPKFKEAIEKVVVSPSEPIAVFTKLYALESFDILLKIYKPDAPLYVAIDLKAIQNEAADSDIKEELDDWFQSRYNSQLQTSTTTFASANKPFKQIFCTTRKIVLQGEKQSKRDIKKSTDGGEVEWIVEDSITGKGKWIILARPCMKRFFGPELFDLYKSLQFADPLKQDKERLK